MEEEPLKITARTGNASYDVIIGKSVLREILLCDAVHEADRTAVVVSKKVMDLHGGYLEECLSGLPGIIWAPMDDAESRKTYACAGEFLEEFIRLGVSRKSLIVGIGGGVAGDFAGFLASVYMRGIPFIQVPTTLLAMVDASVGGKVAVNLSVGKNIVGAFHQPRLVIADTRFLVTLPEREFRNGLAEALKHGLVGDGPTLELLENNSPDSVREPETIAKLIARSVSFKASVVEKDEREVGVRAILNFGHTAGHAIESLHERRGIAHGEAVAFGMAAGMLISRELGFCTGDDVERVRALMERYGLNAGFDSDPDEIIRHMAYDKKNSGGEIRFVLLKGIGRPVFNQRVEEKVLEKIMHRMKK